ncbi:MAG TPA: ATP-binding protein [Verrucomicrobiae bacterium]|nr:ATP-binding protein [Verrucomicrobiae bacterium]
MQTWDLKLPPVVSAIRPAAMQFREWANEHATAVAAADCELALVEACNNLINHNPAIEDPISLHAQATPFDLTITIRDTTPGFAWPANPSLPESSAERGRGIYLMHALMTQVEYHRNGSHNELRLRRAL